MTRIKIVREIMAVCELNRRRGQSASTQKIDGGPAGYKYVGAVGLAGEMG